MADSLAIGATGTNLSVGVFAERDGLGGLDLSHPLSAVGASVEVSHPIVGPLEAFSAAETSLDLTGAKPAPEFKVTSGLRVSF